MPDYITDRQWSDRFIPELTHIAAPLLITPAPDIEDILRNTDLIVLGANGRQVACRVRRHRYLIDYPYDITIRSGRASGAETELTKIIRGLGQYLVYAFATEDGSQLCAWRIIDLGEFRLWFHRRAIEIKGVPGKEQRNGDGASQFLAFDVRDMPAGVVVSEFGFDGTTQHRRAPSPATPIQNW